jgi:hypothetical protein
MTLEQITTVISECCNDVYFVYNGKKSGVTSEVYNSRPLFQSWYGDATKEYISVETLINDKFFSGKSIADLVGEVEFFCA